VHCSLPPPLHAPCCTMHGISAVTLTVSRIRKQASAVQATDAIAGAAVRASNKLRACLSSMRTCTSAAAKRS